MTTLSKQEKIDLFANMDKKEYQKRGEFIKRQADVSPDGIPETVLTVLDGKLETIKESKPGDVVLRNIQVGGAGESYTVPEEIYNSRYTNTGKAVYVDGKSWHRSHATGKVVAAEYVGDPITFEAPWGEQMLCESGDFIACPVGGDPEDVYRIEKKTFEQTYFII